MASQAILAGLALAGIGFAGRFIARRSPQLMHNVEETLKAAGEMFIYLIRKSLLLEHSKIHYILNNLLTRIDNVHFDDFSTDEIIQLT